MALTSQITMRAIVGQNPAGFVPLVPNATSLQTINVDEDYLATALTFTAGDKAQTQADFLTYVKTQMDIWSNARFTDALVTYNVEYQIRSIRVDYVVDALDNNDKTVWSKRTYHWYVAVSVIVNVI